MLLGRNFDCLGGYLLVPARYIVITIGYYCSLPRVYCPLLVVTGRYCSSPLFVLMNLQKLNFRTIVDREKLLDLKNYLKSFSKRYFYPNIRNMSYQSYP